MTAQKNIEFTRVSQEIYGKPGEGPAAALLARRALMGRACYGAGGGGGSFGGLDGSMGQPISGYARPGGGVRPDHPTCCSPRTTGHGHELP